MRIKIDGLMALALTATTAISLLAAGCTTATQSPADRIQARAEAAATIVADPQRAAEVQAALEAMHSSATELEASAAATRADLLAMHRDPSTTPEAFRAAIKAMHERHKQTLAALVDQRLEAAASTTEREWNRLHKD
jgi:hypothetical protein